MRRYIQLSIFIIVAVGLITDNITAQDYPLSASVDIYDLETTWDNEGILKLFKSAWEEGRNYPDKQSFETQGTTIDLEFVRSHTRYRPVIKDESKDIVKNLNHDRMLWCNIPGGDGKTYGGYPQSRFDNDVYSMWNYTALFGACNYGSLQVPGAWVDAAHKNGTRILGGIEVFGSWTSSGDDKNTFQNFILTKERSGQYTYKYSRPFVYASAFFGNDGYNYFLPNSTYQSDDWLPFHAEAKKIAAELGLDGFTIGMQQNNTQVITSNNVKYIYGTSSQGVVFDCFLTHSNSKLNYTNVVSSLNTADNNDLKEDHLFQGTLLSSISEDYWTYMNETGTNNVDRKRINIGLWSDYEQSRFFMHRVGNSPITLQENYQLLLEKAFSGARRNPLNRPTLNNSWGSFQVASETEIDQQLNNSPGFASLIPERTAIEGNLPFETFFSLGNGENYFYKGKVTHGSWYNMSQQDIVPTYRWLVTKKNDITTYASDIDVRFTHEDAYIGGSSLRLSGTTTLGNDIILYRTNLTVSGNNPYIDLAIKLFKDGRPSTGDSRVSVILKKESQDGLIEIAADPIETPTWVAQHLAVDGLEHGDVIEYIGLRVNGSTDDDYKVLVGQLKISDDRQFQQAEIRENSIVVEVKEETTASLSVKMNWEPDYDSFETSIDDFGMVYNDEIYIDHFEIFYKESENGKPKEVGRTSQWAAYIGNIPMSQDVQDAWIGVRSVSTDLRSVSPVKWVSIPRYYGDLPAVNENPYGKSYMLETRDAAECELFDSSKGAAYHISETVWPEKIVTSGATVDLNYLKDSNPLLDLTTEQYYYADNYQLVLNQGQTVTLTVKGHESNCNECMEFHNIKAYIDYDGNYSFLDADEKVGEFCQLSSSSKTIVTNPGISFTFTVPDDAHLGESRLRLVSSDSNYSHPGPTGGTTKGYSIDFPVDIQGTNVNDRQPLNTYKDFRDEGEPELPENIEIGTDKIDESIVQQSSLFSSVSVSGNIVSFINTDKAWIYDLSGRVVLFVPNASQPVSIIDLQDGIYVVKMQNGPVIRSTKIVKK